MAENIQRESPEIARRIVAIEALRNQLSFLETTIGKLHFLTVDAPCDEA
jgi:hypothetical protein